MRKTVVMIFAAVSLVTGCATPPPQQLDAFPRQTVDFQRCPEELRKQYADIERYEGSFSRYFFHSPSTRPPIDTLVREWGEPAGKRISTWNLEPPIIGAALGFSAPGAALFSTTLWTIQPKTVYTWEKGPYTIQCVALNPIARRYTPFLQYWTWTYKGPGCEKGDQADVAVNEEGAGAGAGAGGDEGEAEKKD